MNNKFRRLSPDKNLSPTEYRALMTAAREIRAKGVLSKILQTPNIDNTLEENVKYSQKTSKNIATAGTQQGKLFTSDEQGEIFKQISKTLETIAKSEKDTGKERKEISRLMAKLIVKSDEEIAKLKEDIKTKKDKQAKIEERGIDTEKDKEKYEKLEKEITKLSQAIEGQRGFQKKIKESEEQAAEPEKRITAKEALKQDFSMNLKKLFPGLDFTQKKDEPYAQMLGRKFAEATTGKGSLLKALFTHVTPSEKKPSTESLIESEKELSRIKKGKGFGPRGFGFGLENSIKKPSISLDKNGRWRDENGHFAKAPESGQAVPTAPESGQAVPTGPTMTKGASAASGPAQANMAPAQASSKGGLGLGEAITAAAFAPEIAAGASALASGAAAAGSAALGAAAVGGTAIAGLGAGLYVGDKMFNTSVAEGGSGTLGETYDLMTGKTDQMNKQASDEKADMIAKQRGFSSFEEMKSHNRQMANQRKISDISPSSGASIEDMSDKATQSVTPSSTINNITNNPPPTVGGDNTRVINPTQVRDQGTTIQRIKEKRVFQN
jgi:hypothetical protein